MSLQKTDNIEENTVISKLSKMQCYPEIIKILLLLSQNKALKFLNNEFLVGIIALRDAHLHSDLFEIIINSIKIKKEINEEFLLSIISIYSTSKQEKIVFSLWKDRNLYSPGFFTKLVDILVQEDQILQAMNYFFHFDFNLNCYNFPNLQLFIDKIIDKGYINDFFKLFRENYLENNLEYKGDIDVVKVPQKKIHEESSSLIKSSCESYFSYDNPSNNFTYSESLKTEEEEEQSELESLLETFTNQIQLSLSQYNENETNLDKVTENKSSSKFHKNLILEQQISEALLTQLSKRK